MATRFKKGDKIKIIGNLGEIIEAVYDGRERAPNHHRVKFKLKTYLGPSGYRKKTWYINESRIISGEKTLL